MKEHNIEIKVLIFYCLTFWLFQSIGEDGRTTLITVIGVVLAACLFFIEKLKEMEVWHRIGIYIYASYIQWIAFVGMVLFAELKNKTLVNLANVRMVGVVVVVLLVLIIIPLCLTKRKQLLKIIQSLSKKYAIYGIMLGGYILRQLQVFITTVLQQQNDGGIFADGSMGHLGYIYKIYKHTELPTGNPMDQYQYYQPPLSHIAMGMWARINALLGIKEEIIVENLQVLALFFSSMIIIVTYKIMKEITDSKKGIFVGTALVSFFPYLLEYAGAVNNDTLCTLLCLVTTLYTIRWYKNPKWKSIVISAVSMGCAMMTKMSAAMIAPVMACVFLYKMIINREKIFYYIRQYMVFGVVSIPLGMWFPIKNLISYGVPLNFVPEVPPNQSQYMGGMYTVVERLFKITWAQLKPLYTCGIRTSEDFTYNIGLLFTKYCAFGENPYFSTTHYAKFIGTLMYINIFVLVALVIIMFVIWIKKSKCEKVIKFLVLGTIIMVMLSYLKFCFDYPSACTVSVRYVTNAVVLSMCVIGAGVGTIRKNEKNILVCNMFRCFLAGYILVNSLSVISMIYNI